MQRHEAFTLPALIRWQRGNHVWPYPMHVCLFACCEIPAATLLCNMAPCTQPAECFWPKESVATASVPQLPSVVWTGSVTYVCVVRTVGWVCVFAARQLELGSAASLKGALHGSCVYYTAMAWRLVWQQLTLDLSSPLPGSRAQKHTRIHTHTNRQLMHTLQSWTIRFSHRYITLYFFSWHFYRIQLTRTAFSHMFTTQNWGIMQVYQLQQISWTT